jgi:hypothetical protein
MNSSTTQLICHILSTCYSLGIVFGISIGNYTSKEEVTMKPSKMMIAAVAALTVVSLAAQVFAADRLQTKTRDQIKSGTCTK